MKKSILFCFLVIASGYILTAQVEQFTIFELEKLMHGICLKLL